MKLLNLLTASTAVDSTAVKDTLTGVQAEIAAVAAKITNTPTDVLLSDLVDKAVSFGLKLLAAFAIYFIGAWLIKKVKKLLDKVFEKKGTDAAIASFVRSIVSIALTILLIIVTVGALGIDTTSLAALLAGGGMALGMALNGTVQNFAGGIMILIFRPFKSGDLIEAQGFTGTVDEVTITSTKLVTVDNRVIIIPNGALSNGTVNNYSHMPLRRLDLTVDVEYGSSAEAVKTLVQELIKADQRSLFEASGAPADPFVALSSLKDSSIQFTIRVWVKAEDYWGLNFDLIDRIYSELPKNGIHFPYPKLDVHIKN